MNSQIIFDFTKQSSLSQWQIVDDGVMGGKSQSNFYLNSEGKGIFEGEISLENNGRFCSVRYFFSSLSIAKNSFFNIRLKGDKKQYQFRVKADKQNSHSYVYNFKTTGEWETITIPITELLPNFRGQRLKMPNYDGSTLEEIGFFIGNKEKEKFQLLIENIVVK